MHDEARGGRCPCENPFTLAGAEVFSHRLMMHPGKINAVAIAGIR
jgi:hypothetical protein